MPGVTPFGVYGQLDYDAAADVLTCHVCGRWYHSLAQHARLAHRLTADDYRALAGLNRQTRLITPTLSARLREVTAPLIARLRSEGALRNWREDPERLARDKAAAEMALAEGLRQEGIDRRRSGWTEERRAAAAERRRRRNVAGSDRPAREPQVKVTWSREVACPRCSVTFGAASHRETYCPACRPALQREYGRAYRERRRRAGGVPERGRYTSPSARRSPPLQHCRCPPLQHC